MSEVNPTASDSDSKPPATTTDSGIPAPSDEYSLTVGPTGPTALHDHYVLTHPLLSAHDLIVGGFGGVA
jgi:catalase